MTAAARAALDAEPGGALRALTVRSVGLTLAFACVVAVALSPIFMVPFTVLLGRTLFVSMLLLCAFSVAGQWHPSWLARWVAQALAVALAAPLATALVYALSVRGNVAAFFGNPWQVQGFFWIAGTAIAVGVVLALAALYRERDAQARSLELAFALERSTLARQALDARLATLQAQIEPHFLFNTLANVQALVESGSPRAAPLLQSLISYLRAAMPRLNETEATLGAEAERVRAYLSLMQMRMPDRLTFDVRLDEATLGLRFPPMALLTLVENAVRHGIDPCEEGGRIDVGSSVEADATGERGRRLRVWVADTGIGMAANAAPGVGLTNLRERLHGSFDGHARLDLDENARRGLRATITVDDFKA